MKTIDTFKLLLIMDEFNTLHEKRPEKLKNKFKGILQKLDLSLDDVWENIIPVELSLTMSAPEIINYSDRYRLDSIELFNSLNKNLTEEETDFFNVYINTIIGLYKLKELEEIETMFEIKDLPFIQDLILKFEDVNIISLNPTNQQLIDRLKRIEGKLKLENNNKPQQDNKEKKPTLKEIALLYYYLGKQITRANDNEIAMQYNYKSGGKLYQHYTHYCQKANRTQPEETEKKNNNKLEIFEKVVQILIYEPCKQQTAKNDLKTLQDNTQNKEF